MFGKKKEAKLAAYAERPLMSSNVTSFMEKLGLSEEEIADMANPPSTIDHVQELVDASDRALATFVSETNAAWSQRTGTVIDLQPHFMLSAACWDLQEPQDQTLLKEVVGLIPSQPWNIVLLSMNDETCAHTGAARYPSVISDEAVSATSVAKLSITDELENLKRLRGNERTTDGPEDAVGFAEARDATCARIMAMARPIASALLGQEVIDTSRATFFGD